MLLYLDIMGVVWVISSVMAGWLLGRLVSRMRHAPETQLTSPPQQAHEPPPWLESHVRRQNELGMHRKTQAVQSDRQAVRTASLRHQLSPHFLFNALNSVNWLWVQGKQGQAIDNMGAFIRLWQEHWNNGTDNHHMLAEELDSIAQYLQLEAMRLGIPLEIKVSCQDRVAFDQVVVPKLFLQPLAENTIWHGFAHALTSHPLPQINLGVTQRLESSEDSHGGPDVQWIDVEILDNGVGLSQKGHDDSSSVGMSMVRETLLSMDSRASLILESAPKPWSTSCKVSFPWVGPMAPIQATLGKEHPTNRLLVPH